MRSHKNNTTHVDKIDECCPICNGTELKLMDKDFFMHEGRACIDVRCRNRKCLFEFTYFAQLTIRLHRISGKRYPYYQRKNK